MGNFNMRDYLLYVFYVAEVKDIEMFGRLYFERKIDMIV